MSDAPFDPAPESASSLPGGEREVEVDLAAFLPEGVVLGEPEAADRADEPGGAEEVIVEEVVVAEPEAPAVDLEALSQIERDLDAVDAAIAALDAGTYGIDAATGEPIPDALLAEDPTRLR